MARINAVGEDCIHGNASLPEGGAFWTHLTDAQIGDFDPE
jgi:hypothetical protein